jgi:hypothetical protein
MVAIVKGKASIGKGVKVKRLHMRAFEGGVGPWRDDAASGS